MSPPAVVTDALLCNDSAPGEPRILPDQMHTEETAGGADGHGPVCVSGGQTEISK